MSHSGKIDFDDYIPIFIYSHGAYPTFDEECMMSPSTIDTFVRPEKNKITETIERVEDLFMKVPKNIVIIDPILEDSYCLSTETVDEVFPWIISKKGNNSFLKGEFMELVEGTYVDDDDNVDQFNELLMLYNNTKLYYPRDMYHNLHITFDINPESIWNIRYYDKDVGEMVQILSRLSRHINESKDNCMYLQTLLNEIQNEPALKGKKLAIYVISCRNWREEEIIKTEHGKNINKLHEQIKNNGLKNTQRISSSIREPLKYNLRSMVIYEPAPKSIPHRKGGKKKTKKYRKQTKNRVKHARKNKTRKQRKIQNNKKK